MIIARRVGVKEPYRTIHPNSAIPRAASSYQTGSDGETSLFARNRRMLQFDIAVPDLRLDVGWESAGSHHGTCSRV